MEDILDLMEETEVEVVTPEVVEDAIEAAANPNEEEIDKERARELTETIKSVAQGVYVLVSEAHRLRVDKVLGYSSWADYCEAEFDMSVSRSYQLINLAETVKAIEAVSPDGVEIKLTEAQARDIKRELPAITQRIAEEVKELSPEDATDRVNEIIEEARADKRAEAKALKEKQDAFEQAEQDGYHRGLEAAADAFLEQNAEKLDDPDDAEWVPSGNLSPADSMNIFNFFNALMNITGLPDPEDFIPVIPQERKAEVSNQIRQARDWFDKFNELWLEEGR